MSAPQIDDGGPAFPWGDYCGQFAPHSGMTLRDWFAGQALMGILSEGGSPASYHEDAENAYKAADAMIRARKGGADGNR